MSFTVRIASDLVAAEAGSTTPVSVIVENRGATADRFELDIEGIDSDWRAVPVPVFEAEPGETHTEKFFFKPPRESESAAGSYPFVVNVRSLESGEVRSAQGAAEIRPFHHLNLEISPKKGYITPFRQQNIYDLSVMNLGNTAHTLRFSGSDPDNAISFDFSPEQITLGPGQQRELEVAMNPTRSKLLSSARLYGVTVTTRSNETPSVGASAQAQLEQRSLLSPGSLAFVVLAGLAMALWLLFMPRAPGIRSFSVNPTDVVVGNRAILKWSAPQASQVTLQMEGQVLADRLPNEGTYEYSVPAGERSNTLQFDLVAERNGMKSDPARLIVRLRQPEIFPDPVIKKLDATPSRIRLGQPFILSYQFANVAKAVLSPVPVESSQLNPDVPSIAVMPQLAGTQEYTVTAYNRAGKRISRKFSVTVVDESTARILEFGASKTVLEPGETSVRISWSTAGSRNIELTRGRRAKVDIDGSQDSGGVDVTISGTTTFFLSVYDEMGRRATRSLTVTVKRPPPPPIEVVPEEPPAIPPGETDGGTVGPTDPPTTGGTTGETGGTTGSTTGTTTGATTGTTGR